MRSDRSAALGCTQEETVYGDNWEVYNSIGHLQSLVYNQLVTIIIRETDALF